MIVYLDSVFKLFYLFSFQITRIMRPWDTAVSSRTSQISLLRRTTGTTQQ